MAKREDFDVVVIGAGLGGMYAVHRFRQMGLKVVGLEASDGFGGVWRHNCYPGARVDLESADYCYQFSSEISREWQWSERFASQPELLRYLEFVADRLALKDHFRFHTPMQSADWRPDSACYDIEAGSNLHLRARFLVMATGNLSEPREIRIPRADRFRGEMVSSSNWPRGGIKTAGRRVGIVGTGSSGVQIATALAGEVDQLHIFQRSANYSVPARNAPVPARERDLTDKEFEAARVGRLRTRLGVLTIPSYPKPASEYTPTEQLERLEMQWQIGGQGMGLVFIDQGVDKRVNDLVSNFVQSKIRNTVKDPVTAEKLCPNYPLGTRRLIVDTGYYEIFNQENVTLVDVSQDPIQEITETGLKTRNHHFELDVLVMALGFEAFTGKIRKANIRNERGETPIDRWKNGPATVIGLMTARFPNLFLLTAPGSPSVLSNMFLMNEYHADWVADCIQFMAAHGYKTIEPSIDSEECWTQHVCELAGPLLRLQIDNYMVHVSEDGSRRFMPYTGGLSRYIEEADAFVENGYQGFEFK